MHIRAEDPPTAEALFVKLSEENHPDPEPPKKKAVRVKHVFSQMGSRNFLVDLDKCTPMFMRTVVKNAFGSHCSVECVKRFYTHETFVPAGRKAGEGKLSTMEQEALYWAAAPATARTNICSAPTFVLVDNTQRVVYPCNSRGQLGKGSPEPRGEPVGVGPTTDTTQVRSMALMHGTHPGWRRVFCGGSQSSEPHSLHAG